MRVLLAFDKFKDSVTAERACEIAAGALASARPDWTVDRCPLADGGEGFAETLALAAGGKLISCTVTGPRGSRVAARYGIVSISRVPLAARQRMGPLSGGPAARIGIADMASASGLALVPGALRDPERCTSAGTGELISALSMEGVAAVLLGVGGSATHDLGLGALGALGLRFRAGDGSPIDGMVPLDWPRLRSIEGRIAAGLPPVLIACDVNNPLLGPEGALAVYGPQKGLVPGRAAALERETGRVARLLAARFGRPEALLERPGAGAAGGTAFGLLAGLGASLLPGFDLVSAWLDLDRRLDAADLVLTGEGRFDDSSLRGKGPGEVARRALARGKAVRVFAGHVSLARPVEGLEARAVTPKGMALDEALRRAPELLADRIRSAFA